MTLGSRLTQNPNPHCLPETIHRRNSVLCKFKDGKPFQNRN